MGAKKSIIADTSALISLDLAGALEPSLEIVSWTIPEGVADELKELTDFEDAVGKAADRVLGLAKGKRIDVKTIEADRKVLDLVDFGEACAFSLCLREKISLFACDDVDAGYRLDGLARANKIRIVIGAAVIVELVRQKVWTKKEAVAAVAKMIQQRDWEGGVLAAFSRKYLENL